MIPDNFPNPQRIFGLDLLRATAILMVLCSHCLWIFPPSNSNVAQLCKLFGFLGVEIFFVLSGFLIGRILYRDFVETPFSFKTVFSFLKRRWFRTLPNYYLVLLLNIIIAFYIGYSVESLWEYFLFLHNFQKPLQLFFNESWTLSVEEWTYFLVPLTLLISAKIFKQYRKHLFLGTIVFMILIFLLSKVYYDFIIIKSSLAQWNSSLKSVVIYRIDSILYGMLAAFINLNYIDFWKKNKNSLLVFGLTGLFFINFGQRYFLDFPLRVGFFHNVIYIPANSILIGFTLPYFSTLTLTKNPLNSLITQVSIVSYSVYLLHYGVILQLLKFWFPTDDLSQFQLIFYTIGYLAITFFISTIFYNFYEKPTTDLRDK